MNIPATDTGVTARPPGGAEAAPLRAGVARSFGSDAPGRETWNELVARSGGTVYQTYEWLSLWWESYGEGKRLHIVVFRSGDAIVGIAPLFAGGGPGANGLRFIGSGSAFSLSGGMFNDDGPSDYLDFIVDPARGHEVGRAFAEHLLANAESPGRADLVNLRPDGPGLRFIVPALQSTAGLDVSETEGDACFAVAVSGPVQDFIRSLDAGARRRYTQASRLLTAAETDPAVSYRTIEPAGWDATYADLVRLHQARWNRAGFPGLFQDRVSLGFQKRAAAELHRRGWLWYGALYDGERCIAARLGFVFRGRMYDYLSGFDDLSAWAKKRPGMALILRMYDDAFAKGLKTLDLLRGDEPYKAELTAVKIVLKNVTVRTRTGRSRRLAGAASSAAKLAGFLIGREARLLAVQVRQHGAARGIGSYIGFRSRRLSNKLHNHRGTSANG